MSKYNLISDIKLVIYLYIYDIIKASEVVGGPKIHSNFSS